MVGEETDSRDGWGRPPGDARSQCCFCSLAGGGGPLMYGRPGRRVGPEAAISSVMSWPVVIVGMETPIVEVAEALAADEVGAVGVFDHDALVGVVSERDLVALLASGSDPSQVTASEVMSQDLVTVSPQTTIVEAARLMSEAEIRHLPVLTHGLVAGIVSARDLFEVLLERAELKSITW
jgi:CBS domain-containing protein